MWLNAVLLPFPLKSRGTLLVLFYIHTSKQSRIHDCLILLCIRGENLIIILLRGNANTSLVAQAVKHLPTMRETQAQSLVWEDLLEKEMATHSSTLA